MPRTRRPIEQRFWKHVEKTDTCWNWTGTISKYGYGFIQYNGRSRRAHRVVYELTNGPIPDGLMVCHHCDNRRCVRPDHLFLGTAKDNIHDMFRKGRQAEHIKNQIGELNRNARLTAAQVDEIRQAVVSKTHNMYQLARIYGVHRDHIRNIIRRKKWQTIET